MPSDVKVSYIYALENVFTQVSLYLSIRYSLHLFCINFSWRGILHVYSAFICI